MPDMSVTVESLEHFYHESELGCHVRKALGHEIGKMWPDLRRYDIVGVGYAGPVLSAVDTCNSRIVNLLPCSQPPPEIHPAMVLSTVVVTEMLWPLPTSFAERMVVVHGLEMSSNPSGFMKECWRVLAPEGRIAIVVANRTGLWARSPSTPFGAGNAFTVAGVKKLLEESRFELTATRASLFSPPEIYGRHLEKAQRLDQLGNLPVARYVGGVSILEARKRVFAKLRPGLGKAVQSGFELLQRVGTPKPEPASGR
ncbi:MAG: hypothetical protein OXB95_02125 [Rhodobacteraceae bacterium]|nr:hypothetical protein [Paracoccaceae bacterium]